MERNFGTEMARTFGTRLRRIYQQDEQTIPSRIAVCMEQLQRSEEGRSAASGNALPDDESTSYMPGAAPSISR